MPKVFSLLFREMIAVRATRRICLKVEFVGVVIQIRYTEERLTSDERSEARRQYGLLLLPIYTSCKPPVRVYHIIVYPRRL